MQENAKAHSLYSIVQRYQKVESEKYQLTEEVELPPNKGVIFGLAQLTPKVINFDEVLAEVKNAKNKGQLEAWACLSLTQRGLQLVLNSGEKVAAFLNPNHPTNWTYLVDEPSNSIYYCVISTTKEAAQKQIANWQNLLPGTQASQPDQE